MISKRVEDLRIAGLALARSVDELRSKLLILRAAPPPIRGSPALENIRSTALAQLDEAVDGWSAAIKVYTELEELPSPPESLIKQQQAAIRVILRKIKCLGQTVAAAVLTAKREGGIDHQIQFCRDLIKLAHDAQEEEEEKLELVLEEVLPFQQGLFVISSSALVAADAAWKAATKETKAKEPKETKSQNLWFPRSNKRSYDLR